MPTKKHRVFLLIGMCWLIAFSLGALPILGWNCLHNLPRLLHHPAPLLQEVHRILHQHLHGHPGDHRDPARTHLLPGEVQQPQVASPHRTRAVHGPAVDRGTAEREPIACWSPLFILSL